MQDDYLFKELFNYLRAFAILIFAREAFEAKPSQASWQASSTCLYRPTVAVNVDWRVALIMNMWTIVWVFFPHFVNGNNELLSHE